MKTPSSIQSGFVSLPVLLAVLAVLAVSGGAYWWYGQQKAPPVAEEQKVSNESSNTITLLSPNAGDVWVAGKTYTIAWQPTSEAASIYIVADKNALCGETPCAIISQEYIPAGVGKLTFTLPSNTQPGKYYVRLNTLVGGPTGYSSQFTVSAPDTDKNVSIPLTATRSSGPAPLSLWFIAGAPRDNRVYTVDTGDGKVLTMVWDNGSGLPGGWSLGVSYMYSVRGTYTATLYADGIKLSTINIAVQ